MKEVFFVRHGETEWNAIARMQGQWNSNLNATGRAQADANGLLLKDHDVEALYASPLDRTRQTAAIVNRHLGLEVTYDERIMEWNCGDWSGHLYREIQRLWPAEWAALRADRFNYRGPNCENYPDMIARATPFLDALLDTDADRIAVVSHGMIGRVMVSILLGLDADGMLGFNQPNDVVYRVTRNAAGTVADHFVAGEGPFEGLSVA